MAKQTLKPTNKSQKPNTFSKGGLHRSTNTPQGTKISSTKMSKALSGGYGPKAKRQALFAKDVLTGRKKK